MRCKPRSTVKNRKALLYRRFTDLEKSASLNAVYKTVDDKLWVFDKSKVLERKITQLVGNPNFNDTNGWDTMGDLLSLSAENNELVCHFNGTPINQYVGGVFTNESAKEEKNHKYFVSFDYKMPSNFSGSATIYIMGVEYSGITAFTCDNQWHTFTMFAEDEYLQSNNSIIYIRPYFATLNIAQNFYFYYRKVKVFDLTEDFGVGNEPQDIETCENYYADKDVECFTRLQNGGMVINANIIPIQDTTILQYKKSLYKYVNNKWQEIMLKDEQDTLLSARYSNIANYQTNKYYFVRSFDYMVRGSIDSSETQPLRGLITPLTSFSIKYYDDTINLDHDDLLVIDGHLYSVDSPTVDVKWQPKPFKIYFCDLNSIL